MAYRRLFEFAFLACGMAAAACGGGSSNSNGIGADGTSEHAPVSADQAPVSADQAPVSADQAPVSADQAPVSADQAPGGPGPKGSSGGGATATCQALCTQVGGERACIGNDTLSQLVRAGCRRNCVLGSDDLQCETQITALFVCAKGVDGICTEDGPAPGDASSCNDELQAVTTCEDAGQMMMPKPTDSCTMEKGCDCGNDTCKTCRCALGAQDATCMQLCQ
jgi:hypothetical protein